MDRDDAKLWYHFKHFRIYVLFNWFKITGWMFADWTNKVWW